MTVGFHSWLRRGLEGHGWLRRTGGPVVQVQAPGITMILWWEPEGFGWREEPFAEILDYSIPNTNEILSDSICFLLTPCENHRVSLFRLMMQEQVSCSIRRLKDQPYRRCHVIAPHEPVLHHDKLSEKTDQRSSFHKRTPGDL